LRVAIGFKRYFLALVRWQREWWCGIADAEYLVFPWHGHTLSEIVADVKFLVDGYRRSVVSPTDGVPLLRGQGLQPRLFSKAS
jgi:hypothetical protein